MVVVFFLSRFQHEGGKKNTQKKQKDLARNSLFIILRGWDLDLYFYSFEMPLFEIHFFFN